MTGEQSLLIVEAVELVLQSIDAQMIVSNNHIDIIDREVPEGFSYVEEAVNAVIAGKKTVLEIATYISEKRKRTF